MMHVVLVDHAIDTAALLRRAGTGADGACVLFLGTVRDSHEGRRVVALEYEAYPSMAERVLRGIAEDAAREHAVSDIAIEHRVGRLAVGETSVAVAVRAPHRDAAYRASRAILERLKREAPIWKREVYAEGGSAWLGGPRPAPEGSAV
ncbi:MAG: molybdenum cofactor biosynthesis protein MoaE [Gemmatimonadota bacterium]